MEISGTLVSFAGGTALIGFLLCALEVSSVRQSGIQKILRLPPETLQSETDFRGLTKRFFTSFVPTVLFCMVLGLTCHFILMKDEFQTLGTVFQSWAIVSIAVLVSGLFIAAPIAGAITKNVYKLQYRSSVSTDRIVLLSQFYMALLFGWAISAILIVTAIHSIQK